MKAITNIALGFGWGFGFTFGVGVALPGAIICMVTLMNVLSPDEENADEASD